MSALPPRVYCCSQSRETPGSLCVQDKLTERIPFEQKVVGFLVQEECIKEEGRREKDEAAISRAK
jgi:hypothetical protein